MWLLAKKKGVSIMVGYVLLVTCAIIIGVLVYQWIKTYIPADALECPEGVSIFIKEYTYDCTSGSEKLTITLKNNGLFNIAGYFIHATNDSNQTLATIDLSNYTALGEGKGGTVLFSTTNSFKPNDEETNMTFNLGDSGIGQIYSIEIIPVRFQEEEGKERFVSCGGSKVEEVLSCGVETVTCINGETQNCPFQEGVCSGSERTCTGGEWPICDYTGITGYEQPESNCTDSLDNDCDGYTDGVDTDCGGTCTDGDTQLCLLQEVVCAGSQQTCTGGAWPGCNYTGITGYESTEISCTDSLDNDCDGYTDGVDTDCEAEGVCGNGIIESPEVCDDGNTVSGDGCQADCSVQEDGWMCTGQPSYCIDARIIFVSSTTFNGNLSGISSADAECNTLADASSLIDERATFKAWLSDSTQDIIDSISDYDLKFNRTDYTEVAENNADLLNGPNPVINIDESGGEHLKQGVWTGTDSTGHVVVGYNCNNWQSSTTSYQGAKGKTDKDWTYETEETCEKIFRLYCVQIS